MVDHARALEWGGSTPAPPTAPNGSFAAPDSPVLLVGAEPWWETNGLLGAIDDAGWSWLGAADTARARWLASIRRVSLVVVGGDAAMRWDVVRDVRSVTSVPLIVLSEDSSEIAALIAAGVDGVLAAGEAGDAMFAQLLALLRRADHRRSAGTRYLHAGALRSNARTSAFPPEIPHANDPSRPNPIRRHLSLRASATSRAFRTVRS